MISIKESTYDGGIATQALAYSIQEAFKNGAVDLWVDPHPANVKAIDLYHKLGFVQKEMPEYVIAMGEDPTLYTYMELEKNDFSLKLEDAINTIEDDNKKEMLKKADSYLKRRSSN
ncbi:GNAT family N-acetyltransferase [Butyrivibrio fibrisolvens]|uniref:GNAT family N-acetyltransferase n=1 Tax=Butyrivibrio fibrisolvens TaxID=831 RepID=UPI0003B5A192|nr:GNAT family N-acetyltransferase [Butyrivibrio fibrisolvens]